MSQENSENGYNDYYFRRRYLGRLLNDALSDDSRRSIIVSLERARGLFSDLIGVLSSSQSKIDAPGCFLNSDLKGVDEVDFSSSRVLREVGGELKELRQVVLGAIESRLIGLRSDDGVVIQVYPSGTHVLIDTSSPNEELRYKTKRLVLDEDQRKLRLLDDISLNDLPDGSLILSNGMKIDELKAYYSVLSSIPLPKLDPSPEPELIYRGELFRGKVGAMLEDGPLVFFRDGKGQESHLILGHSIFERKPQENTLMAA